MHVQIVTYRIAEISDPEFIEANQKFAALMTAVPGLLAKVWLQDRNDAGVYGGVYLWQDKDSCANFLASDLWKSVLAEDSISDLSSHDYAVTEELTKLTQPRLAVL